MVPECMQGKGSIAWIIKETAKECKENVWQGRWGISRELRQLEHAQVNYRYVGESFIIQRRQQWLIFNASSMIGEKKQKRKRIHSS